MTRIMKRKKNWRLEKKKKYINALKRLRDLTEGRFFKVVTVGQSSSTLLSFNYTYIDLPSQQQLPCIFVLTAEKTKTKTDYPKWKYVCYLYSVIII